MKKEQIEEIMETEKILKKEKEIADGKKLKNRQDRFSQKYILIGEKIEYTDTLKKKMKENYKLYELGDMTIAVDPNEFAKTTLKSLLRKYNILKDLTAIYITMLFGVVTLLISVYCLINVLGLKNNITQNQNNIINYISGLDLKNVNQESNVIDFSGLIKSKGATTIGE